MRGVLFLGISLLAASALLFAGPAQASQQSIMQTQIAAMELAVAQTPVLAVPAVAQVVHDPGSTAGPAADAVAYAFRQLRAIGKGFKRLLCFRGCG